MLAQTNRPFLWAAAKPRMVECMLAQTNRPFLWAVAKPLTDFDNPFSYYYQPNNYLTNSSLIKLITLNSTFKKY